MVEKKCPKGQYLRKGYNKKAYRTKEGEYFPTTYVPPACVTMRDICPEGQLLRLGYKRKAYARKTKTGKVVHVPATYVEPTCIEDVGKKGRGAKVIKLSKKLSLRTYNYSTKKTVAERHASLDRAVKVHGPGPIVERLNKLSVLQTRRPTISKKFIDDMKYVQKKYKYKLY